MRSWRVERQSVRRAFSPGHNSRFYKSVDHRRRGRTFDDFHSLDMRINLFGLCYAVTHDQRPTDFASPARIWFKQVALWLWCHLPELWEGLLIGLCLQMFSTSSYQPNLRDLRGRTVRSRGYMCGLSLESTMSFFICLSRLILTWLTLVQIPLLLYFFSPTLWPLQ